MSARGRSAAMAALLVLSCLAACGQKGALYLPDKGPQSVPKVESAPATDDASKSDATPHKSTAPAAPER